MRGRQLLFALEISIPLFIAFVLLVARHFISREKENSCYLREKTLVSLGIVPFMRDLMCNIQTSCINTPQINWNDTSDNLFIPFLTSIKEIYNDLPTAPYSIWNVGWWALGGKKIAKIKATKAYFDKNFGFLVDNIGNLTSNNKSESDKAMKALITYTCGSKYNDIAVVLNVMNSVTPNKKSAANLTCQESMYEALRGDVVKHESYKFLAPLLFGKIYFAPDSPFIRELVRKVNKTFALIDSIRLASIQWRIKFRFDVENLIRNDPKVESLRKIARLCGKFGFGGDMCNDILEFLKIENIKPKIDKVTKVMSMVESALNCLVLNKFIPLNSSIDIDNLENTSMTNIFAAVVFDESTRYSTSKNITLLKYAIRMSTNRIDATKYYKVLDKFWTPLPRLNTGGHLRYYSSGFLFLQEAIDHAFIELITNKTIHFGTSIQIMPYPCYQADLLGKYLVNILPFLFIIGWAPSFIILLQNIVYEKEKRLKQYMCIMGLSNRINWISRFIFTLTVQITPIILISLIIIYGNIIYHLNFFVIFAVLFSFVISYICQAFMISVIFDNTNLATVCGGILYFVFYLPFLVFVNSDQDLTVEMYYGWRLFSQVSFCNAINFILYWDQSTNGVEFPNLTEITNVNIQFEIWHCVLLMWLDSFFYILITWYFGNVFPGRYGIGKPWYYIFTKKVTFSFMTGIRIQDHFPVNSIQRELYLKEEKPIYGFEEEPENLKVSISIQRLVKKYSPHSEPVVNDFSLEIYESHITALLGHNGAGKTTVVSVLTGLFAPTSGSAFILNMDIRNNIKAIRRNLGFCPQINILFNNITVGDHIYFYGVLKGLTHKNIKILIPQLLRDAGMSKYLNILVKHLSYGMRRKLIICISFIGNSRIVILDEPTVGIDPFARKQIWDVILNNRSPEKSIILITQDMDEADYLSDRIAIMVHGKLKCCGSPIFLKRQYGEGYKLNLFKHPKLRHIKIKDGISSDGEKVYSYVKGFIKDAIFTEETNVQWKITLPQNQFNNVSLSTFFKDLDVSFEKYNILTYEFSDTSLEDVFFKILDDPSVTEYYNKTNSETIDFLTNYYNYIKLSSFLSLDDKTIMSEVDKLNYQSLEIVLKYDTYTGLTLLYQQIEGLLIKRFHYTKRNFKAFMAEILLPNFMIFLMIVLKINSSPNGYQPSMTISPWLMMRNQNLILNTFVRKDITNYYRLEINELYEGYKSELGESGIRCMNVSIFQLKNFPCNIFEKSPWVFSHGGPFLLRTPDCDCNISGYQFCPNNRSGGPPTSYRVMPSTDRLHDLTGYNLSDYLIKNFKKYIGSQFGGYQFLFRSFIGEVFSIIGSLEIFTGLRSITDKVYDLSVPTFLNLFQNFFKISGEKNSFNRVWSQTQGYISMPAYVNILSNLVLRSKLTSDIRMNYGIVIDTHPFRENKPDLYNELIKILFMEVSLDIFVIVGLSFIPASFVIFLIEERTTGFKRQQLVSGVNPYVYWFSTFVWDIVKYIVSIVFVILTFVIFQYHALIGWKNVGAFVILLVCYGFAIMPHMYPFSFFLSTPSTAFVVLYIYNLLVGSITTIFTFVTDQMIKDNLELRKINGILKIVFLIFPQYSLGRGMMDLSFNYMQYDFSDSNIDYNPFAWETTLEKMVALMVMSLIWWFIMILIISGIIKRIFTGTIRNVSKHYSNYSVIIQNLFKFRPFKVVDKSKSNKTSNFQDYILELVNLTKSYKSGKIVVRSINLNIKKGECLGLIGVNGSGKSTIFKLIIGEESVTKGEVLINGCSMDEDIMRSHKVIGFCPQFDALHSLLTCYELLYFYCRLRGVERQNIRFIVYSVLKVFGMLSQSNKLTYTLSGGNKRKLSTAITLIGFPKILILDDPTASMDIEAQQVIWNIIQKITYQGKRAVFVTTNNMKGCEIICNKVAMITNGEIKYIETIQDLKSRCGSEYYVRIRMQPNRDRLVEKLKLKILINREFPKLGALTDENSVALTFRFTKLKLYKIFDFFELQKETGQILDYSISQLSLDDVFNSLVNTNFSRSDSSKSVSKMKM